MEIFHTYSINEIYFGSSEFSGLVTVYANHFWSHLYDHMRGHVADRRVDGENGSIVVIFFNAPKY